MKIAIVKNNYLQSKQAVVKIKKYLSQKHIITATKPDVIIAVGGDGTFLNSVQKFWVKNPQAVFFAIHSGTLGFYSDYTCAEIEMFLDAFESKVYEVQKADVLQMKINSKMHYALNDIRIESSHKTMVSDVYVNDTHLELFRGNGLCFSTQTGSTAYNKSLGGAIMWPTTSGFQMTEVAPISNNAYSSLGSSIIFGLKDKVRLNAYLENAFVSYDTKYHNSKGNYEIEISISSKKLNIARFIKHYNFYKRLKDGFIK